MELPPREPSAPTEKLPRVANAMPCCWLLACCHGIVLSLYCVWLVIAGFCVKLGCEVFVGGNIIIKWLTCIKTVFDVRHVRDRNV